MQPWISFTATDRRRNLYFLLVLAAVQGLRSFHSRCESNKSLISAASKSKNSHAYEVCSILNFSGLRIFDFRFFCGVMLVLMFLIYAGKYSHFEFSFNFWHLLCLHVFWLAFYSKKWIKESVSNFVWKIKLSAQTHSECWLWHMVKLPWTEAINNFW